MFGRNTLSPSSGLKWIWLGYIKVVEAGLQATWSLGLMEAEELMGPGLFELE
jgi:hypothetical protein